MKKDRLVKILLIAFLLSLALYVLTFSFIQTRRTKSGPWNTVFLTDSSGKPALLIESPSLKISEKLVFADQTLPQKNLAQPFIFDDPTQTNAPFGEIVFLDLTFLPGTVTFNFFGHEVELLPRVLIIDKQEYAWKNGDVITVTGEGKYKPRPRK